jgi:MoxR-like ATPase
MSEDVIEEPKASITRTKSTNTKADAVLSMFDQISEDVLKSVQAKIDRRVAAKVKHLEEAINAARPIFIKSGNFESQPVTGIQHSNFETLIRIVSCGQPVMLVGPAGTGKSHAAEQVSSVLGLEFYAMSVGAQTSKSDLIGYMDAMKNYVSTPFRKAYENGGLFLLDEIDAGNSNVLIQLNAALANGYMSFPDEMVRRHENFRFVASANTFGQGANRQYVGRNQLDAATLDRFVFLQWNIDENVEETLAVGRLGLPWLNVVRMVREYVNERDLRVVVSPRATQRGSRLLASDLDFNDVLHMALLSQFAESEKQELHVKAHTLFREECAALPKEDEVTDEVVDDSGVTLGGDEFVAGIRGTDVHPDWDHLDNLRHIISSNCNWRDAYEYMFGAPLLQMDTSDENQAAEAIVLNLDDSMKWGTVKALYETHPDKRANSKMKVAVVKYLRFTQWDMRSHLAASLDNNEFNFVAS